jgi:hypothetical protein
VSVATVALGGTGAAGLAVAPDAGTHLFTATYGGDRNFLLSVSPGLSEVVTAAALQDFSLASVGGSSQTVIAGSAAVFSFGTTVQGGPLNAPILLAATGLPPGAAVSFSPGYLPPGVSAFTMSVQTAATTVERRRDLGLGGVGIALAGMMWLGFRRRPRMGWVVVLAMGFGLGGCGNRVASEVGPAAVSYPITVTGSSTSSTGSVLVHSVVVTLAVD